MTNNNRFPYRFLPVLLAFPFSVLLAVNLLFIIETRDRLHDRISDLPHRRAALVLGTSSYVGAGKPSPFFAGRMQAALELWRQDKVDYLLLSGDNQFDSYNEPIRMKAALEHAGVPSDRLVLDFAGFSTLDSIIRARKVFGQKELIVVSQQFQNERAVFIANFSGIRVDAYNAPGGGRRQELAMAIREFFARPKAFLDLFFLGTQPRFLGEEIEIE